MKYFNKFLLCVICTFLVLLTPVMAYQLDVDNNLTSVAGGFNGLDGIVVETDATDLLLENITRDDKDESYMLVIINYTSDEFIANYSWSGDDVLGIDLVLYAGTEYWIGGNHSSNNLAYEVSAHTTEQGLLDLPHARVYDTGAGWVEQAGHKSTILYVQYINYTPDLPVVDVNVTAPINLSAFSGENNTPIDVNFSLSTNLVNNVNCSFYVNNVLNDSMNGINASGQFNVTLNPPGSWVILELNCSDELDNDPIDTDRVTIWVDAIDPVIDIDSPLNNSNHLDGDSIEFDSDCTDQELYSYYMEITDWNGSTYDTLNVTDINGTTYANETFIDATTFSDSPAGNYSHYYYVRCSDAHTRNELIKLTDPVKDGSVLDFGTISLEVTTLGLNKLDYERQTDRYVFDIGFLTATDEISYKVYATKIVHRKDSAFCGHLILDDTYWIDFEGEGVKSCSVRIFDGYAVIDVSLEQAQVGLKSESLGELNIVEEYVYFSTYTPPTADWSVTCGEKYPDNTFNLSFSGQGLTNCTLRINDFLYDGWDADCENISITANIGRAYMQLYSDSLNDTCTIFLDKLDKDLGDFMWYVMIIMMILVWLWVGFRHFAIGYAFAGITTMYLGWSFMAYYWLLGVFTIGIGIVIGILSFMEE